VKRILKWLVILLAGVLVLLVVAIGIFAATFDPNAYRDEVAELVKKQTGRELQIPGEIGLTFFPWLGAKIGEVSLGNAPGFADRPFARLEGASVRVKLLPLFKGEIEIAKVVIHGLDVELIRKKNGKTNWDDLTGKDAAEPAAATQPAEQPAAAPLGALAIAGVELRDSRMVWVDHASDQKVVVDKLALDVGAFQLGKAFPVSTRFEFKNASPAVEGEFKLSTQVTVDLDSGHYTLQTTQLDVLARGETLPGGKLDTQVKVPAIKFNAGADTLQVQDLSAKAAGMELRTELSGEKLSTAPKFGGEIVVQPFSPRALMKVLQIDLPATADKAVLEEASFKTKLSATTDAVELNGIELRLDDTTATGTASIRQFDAPAYAFKLDVDQLNADRYLPPPAEGETAQPAATPGAAALGIPVEPLRGLNLNGTLSVGQLTITKLQLLKVVVTTVAKEGLVRVHPFTAKLYQGNYAGDLRLDVRGNKPKYSADESVTNVQVGPLLKDMVGDDYVTGKATLNATIASAGDTVPEIKKQLGGAVKFAFEDGYVKGVDVIRDIRTGYADLVGQSVKPEDKERRTYFSSITGSANIQNGVVKNDDLYAKAPLMRVKGQGDVNLVSEKIDYRATVRLTDSAKGQLGKEYDQLAGVDIPLFVKGGFDKLKYGLDWDSVAKARAKQALQKEVDKGGEKLKKELGDQLDDSLKKQLGDDLLKNLKF